MPAARAWAVYSLAALLAAAAGPGAEAAEIVVAPSGGDFSRIQDALDAAQAGDLVRVRAGIYPETVVFRRGGTPGAPLVLEAWPGERPILDGTGGPRPDIIRLDDVSHVRVRGLELRGLRGVTDGSGIRITGAGTDIEVRDNRIHDLRGRNAMGITVYGTRAAAIRDLVIEGNLIFDCDVAPSEALTLNGNVDGFLVADNDVRDVNNIGIDAIGGERDIQPDRTLVARNGTIRGNRVVRARSSYGGGYAAGIYVDGGRHIVVERNLVTESDLGIEIGAENPGSSRATSTYATTCSSPTRRRAWPSAATRRAAAACATAASRTTPAGATTRGAAASASCGSSTRRTTWSPTTSSTPRRPACCSPRGAGTSATSSTGTSGTRRGRPGSCGTG